MSPRPKKDTDTESTTTTEAPTPRKRGRPRKNPEADAPETVVAAAADGAVEAEAPSEPAEEPAKPRRGRKPRAAKADEAGSDGEGAAEPAASDDGDDGERAVAREREERDDREDRDDDAGGGDGRRGRGRGRNRGNRPARKPSLNFRELQSKILPELHLLAKEVGLEEYRQMEKDDLAVAILERSAEAEGLRLVRGYLEISSDGYGFLQESLLQNNTRSVIVSAGLIKQFRLRTGDYITGRVRPPKEGERYFAIVP